jgi:hypothetical protein
MDLLPEFSGADLIAALRGGGAEVTNHFSIDPHPGRLWVAATAPDGEDGNVDGVSEVGALYGLDPVASGPGFDVVEACHRFFSGGSASTPALLVDGTRVYVGDAVGNLIAVDSSCNEVWTLNIGLPIIGSVGVSSDNDELYVATRNDIIQVIDQGTSGVVGWTANLDVYETPIGLSNFSLNLVSIGANGLGFQAGAGWMLSNNLPRRVGVGVLDRATGEVRYFADGFDETVAVMSTGPDGALYIGNSPLRRAFTRALDPVGTLPLVCGVTRFNRGRLDLLIRDAVQAAADRAANADANSGGCPGSALADIVQIQDLIDQTRAAAPDAIVDGDLHHLKWEAVEAILAEAEANLTRAGLGTAAQWLDQAVATLEAPPPIPAVSTESLAVLALMLLAARVAVARKRRPHSAGTSG